MPIRIVRQIVFLVSMILLSFIVAGATVFMVTYKEGGIFDSGFRQSMELSEMQLKSDEVLEGLPSLTVYMKPNERSVGEEAPEAVLAEVGRSISNASRRDTSESQIVNVDYRTDPSSEAAEVRVKFRFNASTEVDYNDDVYESTYRLLSNLIDTERFSEVSVESTPTPDGGRSLNVETVMKNTHDDNSPLEVSNAWGSMLVPMTQFVGNEGNLSSAKINFSNASLSADFFNKKTFDEAKSAGTKIFTILDTVINSSASSAIEEANFNIAPSGTDDSSLTVRLSPEVSEDSFDRLSSSIFDFLNRAGYSSLPWTVVVNVEDNPDLTTVVFGTGVPSSL